MSDDVKSARLATKAILEPNIEHLRLSVVQHDALHLELSVVGTGGQQKGVNVVCG